MNISIFFSFAFLCSVQTETHLNFPSFFSLEDAARDRERGPLKEGGGINERNSWRANCTFFWGGRGFLPDGSSISQRFPNTWVSCNDPSRCGSVATNHPDVGQLRRPQNVGHVRVTSRWTAWVAKWV